MGTRRKTISYRNLRLVVYYFLVMDVVVVVVYTVCAYIYIYISCLIESGDDFDFELID